MPGGRFVAELGGAGNVTTIVEAVQAHLREHGYEREHPWCFPTVGEYAATLEAGGFEVRLARLFDRPTDLEGPDGLRNWLDVFGDSLFAPLDDRERDAAVAAVEDRLRPTLYGKNLTGPAGVRSARRSGDESGAVDSFESRAGKRVPARVLAGVVAEVDTLDDQVVVGVVGVGLVVGDEQAVGTDTNRVGTAVGHSRDDEAVAGVPVADDVTGVEVTRLTEGRRAGVFGDERRDAAGGTVRAALAWRGNPSRGDLDGDAAAVFADRAADLVVGTRTRTVREVDDVGGAALAVDGVSAPAQRANGHPFGPGAGGPLVQAADVRCECSLSGAGWLA